MSDARRPARRGTLLIVVAGMSAMMLSLALAFLATVRSDVDGSAVMIQSAQQRLMLTAAFQYIQESARLGWGGDDPTVEAYGWTDVRDGQPGPRGPRSSSGAIARLGWSEGGNYPAPGSAMRGDAFCWRRPPYAVSPDMAPSPRSIPREDAREDAVRDAVKWQPPLEGNGNDVDWDAWERRQEDLWKRIAEAGGGAAALDPQPLSEDYDGFRSGVRQPLDGSEGRAWFRIYRERPSDHDGDGDPWYDTVPLTGHGVFIVTVGAGASRGYRFWDAGRDFLGGDRTRTAPFEASLEPQTAAQSRLFADEQVFAEIRAGERIQWWRCEWTAAAGGNLDVVEQFKGRPVQFAEMENPLRATWHASRTIVSASYGGAILWRQRLEREPPRW